MRQTIRLTPGTNPGLELGMQIHFSRPWKLASTGGWVNAVFNARSYPGEFLQGRGCARTYFHKQHQPRLSTMRRSHDRR